jgi:hypothetical protein
LALDIRAIAFGDGVQRFKGSRVERFKGKTFPLNPSTLEPLNSIAKCDGPALDIPSMLG